MQAHCEHSVVSGVTDERWRSPACPTEVCSGKRCVKAVPLKVVGRCVTIEVPGNGMNADGAFAFRRKLAHWLRADCRARRKLDDETLPDHSVQVPGAEQVHRKTRGVGSTVGAAANVVPGAGASAGSAPIVENACG